MALDRAVLDRAHLEVLAALADHPTLRAAAASINLSPSAASRRLSDAERRAGITLVTVTGRAMELTPAGRILADAAVASQRALDEAALAARWIDRGGVRPQRIGLGFHDTITWALDPTAHVEVVRTTERGWPAAVAEGTVDLVIDAGDVAPHLDRHPLADDRLVAVVSTADPRCDTGVAVGVSDFADTRFFASAVEPRPGFEFELLFRPEGASPAEIVRVESAAVALGFVAAGHGWTIQPSLALAGVRGVAGLALTRTIPVPWFAHTAMGTDDRLAGLIAALGARFHEGIGTAQS